MKVAFAHLVQVKIRKLRSNLNILYYSITVYLISITYTVNSIMIFIQITSCFVNDTDNQKCIRLLNLLINKHLIF